MDSTIPWDHGQGDMALNPQTLPKGREAWGKLGVLCRQTRPWPVSIYTGTLYDQSSSVIVPKNAADLSAIYQFVRSDQFRADIKSIDSGMKITNSTFVKVPFDVDFWRDQAEQDLGSCLAAPYSDDPTQWLFHGHPAFADVGTELHVALARIAGFRWTTEMDSSIPLSDLAKQRVSLAKTLPTADADGLLPLHGTNTDRPLADRLRALLSAAYEAPIAPPQEAQLIRAADAKFDKKAARDVSLEGWLRDRAFRQHCLLFQHRPFLWQVWDGLKDGFSAFLHYHRLDYAALEKLTFTLLGDWIAKARAEGRTAQEGRAAQLQQRLRLILEGDQPHDIFVRWKRLARQPLGWHPDLDDGVRLNIRPFMTAEVLREQPRINWSKDRGTDVASAPWYHLGPTYGGKEGDRINDHHLTLSEKRAAQPQAKAS